MRDIWDSMSFGQKIVFVLIAFLSIVFLLYPSKKNTESGGSVPIDPLLRELLVIGKFPQNQLKYFLSGEKNISLEQYRTACKNALLLSSDISSHKYGYGIFSELFQTGASTIGSTNLEFTQSGICIASFQVTGVLRGTPYVKTGYATVEAFDIYESVSTKKRNLFAVTGGPREFP